MDRMYERNQVGIGHLSVGLLKVENEINTKLDTNFDILTFTEINSIFAFELILMGSKVGQVVLYHSRSTYTNVHDS